MTRPIILAQTPRAGRFNHVNLVPAHAQLPARFKPGDILGAAMTKPVGRDYIAASRSVAQGEAARTGQEVLVLAGVRPPAGAAERAAVVKWLENKFADFEAAIRDIDWDRHEGGDRACEALSRWSDEAAEIFHLKPPIKPGGWQRLLRAAAIFAVLAVAAIVQFGRPRDKPPEPKPPIADPLLAAWGRFKEAYPKDQKPDIGAIKQALEKSAGHNFPNDFERLPRSKQEEHLRKVDEFRKWLLVNFGDKLTQEFTPFIGKVSDAAKNDLLHGKLNSVSEVLRVRKMLNSRAAILAKCGRIEFEDLNSEQSTSADLQLIVWVQQLRKLNHADVKIPVGVPFVSDKDRADWKYVVDQDRYLRAALKQFAPKSEYPTPASLHKNPDAVAKRTVAAKGMPPIMKQLVESLKDWPDDEK